MKELIIVKGATDGSATSGTAPLDSDLFQATVTYFRIPKGLKAKVWFIDIAGEGATRFELQYTADVTAATPTYKTLEAEKLSAAGQLSFSPRRPVILHGLTGKEAFRVNWTQGTAALAYFTLGVELSDEE